MATPDPFMSLFGPPKSLFRTPLRRSDDPIDVKPEDIKGEVLLIRVNHPVAVLISDAFFQVYDAKLEENPPGFYYLSKSEVEFAVAGLKDLRLMIAKRTIDFNKELLSCGFDVGDMILKKNKQIKEERVKKLKEDQETKKESEKEQVKEDKTPSSKTDDDDCTVCMSEKKNSAFFPCGHTNCCLVCANKIATTTKKCPICRDEVTLALQIFR